MARAPQAARLARWLCAAGLAGGAQDASAGALARYLSDYQAGVEYSYEYTASTLAYRAPLRSPPPPGCTASPKAPASMDCSATLASPAKGSWSFFLQHGFRRTGLFLLDYDLGFSFFSLDGGYASGDGATPQPLTRARIHLYGLDTKAYVQTGVTPARYLPDLLFAVGLGAQTAGGNLLIQQHRQQLAIFAAIAHTELEIVWLRFGRGALSSYVSFDAGGNTQPVYRGTIDGMSQFTLAQGDYAFGPLKILLPLP